MVNWESLKNAESGWKLDAARRQRIYENCLAGERVGGFHWQIIWKPVAYLAAAAALFMVVLLLWPGNNDPETIMIPGYSSTPTVPDSFETEGLQDVVEAPYAFEPYGSEVLYEVKDGNSRSIYRVALGSKSAPDPVVKKAALLTVEGDYMIFNQGGKLCMLDLKKGGKPIEVGQAATAVVESWQNYVLLNRFDPKNERYQTVLLDLAEQKQIVYDLDYYIADATRIGDTLYYTEWKNGATEGKELKAYSFADGSVETYCRIRTGSDPYEFYLADGRLYYLEEALMYCDLQTKETHQALKPVGFSKRHFCGYYQDRLYLVTSLDFVIYDLKTQQTVATLSESIRYCFSNEYGVVYYDINKREFTVVQGSGSYTVDGLQYENAGFGAFGGTVCEQGFAAKVGKLVFFVKDPQNSMVITIDGTAAIRYDQWFAQHEFWKSEGDMTFEESVAVIEKMEGAIGNPLTDEQRMALYLQACLQIDLHAPQNGNVDQWPATFYVHFVDDLGGKEVLFIRDADWKNQGYSEPFVDRFQTEIQMDPTASRSGTYSYYEDAEGTEQATLPYRDRQEMAELFVRYDAGEVIPTAELKEFYKKLVRYYLSLEGVSFVEAPIRFYEGINFYPDPSE